MIPRLVMTKLAALLGAVALHIAILQPWDQPERAMMETGSGAAVATLGTSFADMVAGTEQSRPLQDMLSSKRPTNRTDPATVTSTPPVAPASAIPIGKPLAQPMSLQPEITRAETAADVIIPPTATSVVAAGTVSLRPRLRPDRPQFAPVPAEPPPAISKTGRGVQDAVQGTASGEVEASAKSQGQPTTTSAVSGTAAAANYPGQVMRHIARQRRPDLDVRGTTVIAFTIGSDGRLADAQVARSSGSSALDRAALKIVHRAAPFPPPPEGARRRHSVGIEGRG